MFGADAQTAKVQKLVEKKAQLEAALPVVDDARAIQIEARLDKIEASLARELARAKAIGNVAAIKAALGVDGIGGLDFAAMSPPGVGRLVRLPFYATGAVPAGYTTGGGAVLPSTTNPGIQWLSGGTFNTANAATMILTTPQISWATLRIVGFETSAETSENAVTGADPIGGVSAAKLVVSDLQIGGGANLFTHEDFGDGEIYAAQQPEFCGLRDYPILKSPNTAQVTVGVVAQCGTAAGDQSMMFSVALLCEVLQDDNYGSHIPGPYARKGAMVRRGGSFV
jgi:hypothetical protein